MRASRRAAGARLQRAAWIGLGRRQAGRVVSVTSEPSAVIHTATESAVLRVHVQRAELTRDEPTRNLAYPIHVAPLPAINCPHQTERPVRQGVVGWVWRLRSDRTRRSRGGVRRLHPVGQRVMRARHQQLLPCVRVPREHHLIEQREGRLLQMAERLPVRTHQWRRALERQLVDRAQVVMEVGIGVACDCR